ncbi:hypothetical protein AHAS_Ahas11G0241200 [Arachis hypogaea]
MVDDSPLSGAVRRNIKRMIVNLNMPAKGSQEGLNVELPNADMIQDNVEIHKGSTIRNSRMDRYEVNPDDGDDADDEPTKIPDEDWPDHFSRLNLDAMTLNWSFTHRGFEEYPTNELMVRQQFENKEEVMLAVKRYGIKKVVEYKILDSDQLKLDSKVIAQYIFNMVKVDPTISIIILQGGVENHFGYKASYRKLFLTAYAWDGSK